MTSGVAAISSARLDASCLDPETISNLLAGRLERADLARVEAHISWCDDCIDVIAVVAEQSDTNPPSAEEPARASAEEVDGVPTVVAIPISARTRRALAVTQDIRRRRASDAPISATEPAVTGRALAVGTMLGRYQIRRFIGRGGMGDVYEGFDLHLERRVALKVMRDAGDAETARQRLAREAKILARLWHPNVVAAHDVGLQERQVFLVMELVEGPTLAAWLCAAPRTWQQVLDVFLQAGEGLAAAHAVGVVHRDFKPQNVLIGTDGKARVSDFGLARSGVPADGQGDRASAQADTPDDVPSPRTDGLIGTPRYMAPEQVLGLPLDARADQFSFCVALHEALFGEHPFAIGDPAAANATSATSSMLPGRNSLDLPKRALLANRAPARSANTSHVPGSIREALERGLGSEPGLRFHSMRELLVELRERTYANRRGNRRGAVVTIAAMVAALGLIGAGAFFASRKATTAVVRPIGVPADWSAAPIFFRVPARICCLNRRKDGRVRVVWGEPRKVHDVDLSTGAQTPADLIPRSYQHGCPVSSPDEQELIYEGFDDGGRAAIFHASNPRGEGAVPIVSSTVPVYRSEPAWLGSGKEFIFDMDSEHPAIFSLATNTFEIIPDDRRRDSQRRGFARMVSPDGSKIAVSQFVETDFGLHVYEWPAARLVATIRMPFTVGPVWRFAADSRRLFGYITNERDDLVSVDPVGGSLKIEAHVPNRDILDYLQIEPHLGILTTRRLESRIWFRNGDGSEHTIPAAPFAWDLSPSLAPNGDILFIRDEGGHRSTARLYSRSDGHIEKVSPGPMDWGAAALPDGTFLLTRSSQPEGTLELVRCKRKFDSPEADCVRIATGAIGAVVAAPDGRFAAFETTGGTVLGVRVLDLASGVTVDLAAISGGCQIIWSGPTTLWVLVRRGDGYQWNEFDVTSGRPSGKYFRSDRACFLGEPHPQPPIVVPVWRVQTADYDLRLVRQ